MFNPLTGTEAAGNATLTPHPVPADPALHTLERSELDRAVFGGLRMARVCAQPVFTYRHARARISDVDCVRSQMLYQRFRVTNTGNIIVM